MQRIGVLGSAVVGQTLAGRSGPNESLLERLQAAPPEARLVKAFNSVGNARMVNPAFAGGKPTMFYCGSDVEAKATVAGILKRFGWEPFDLGSEVAARALDPWRSCGAFRDFDRTTGPTHSRCCGSEAQGRPAITRR